MYGGWNWLKSRFNKAPPEPEVLPPGPVTTHEERLMSAGGMSTDGEWRYPIRDSQGRQFWWHWRVGRYVPLTELPEDLQVQSMDHGRTIT